MSDQDTDIVIACCRDEEDIIVSFIDFYLDLGFDTICLIDNGSRDDTVKRILQHRAHGRILLHRDPRPGYDKRLLEYYAAFARQATRWCFFIDVDEFIPVPGGIKAFADALPAEVTVLRLRSYQMLPSAHQGAERHPMLREERQARIGDNDPPKYVWRAGDVRKICCGKHSIEVHPHVEYVDDRVFMRHYPFRSEQQYCRKMQNRIETLESIDDVARDRLVAASAADFRAYVETSRQMSGPLGWLAESARMAREERVADTAISDWFRQHECRSSAVHGVPA